MGRIFVIGDIHGSIISFNNQILQIHNPTKDDIVICVGDVGIEYDHSTDGILKKAMQKFPGTIIVMRGNHDDCYWKNHGYVNDNGYYQFKDSDSNDWEFVDNDEMFIHQKSYPNIWYVDDNGGIYTINGYNILFLPGAYSIDKYYRLDNEYPWNPNEQLSDKIKKELYNLVKDWIDQGFDIDFVIGHTFPYKLEGLYKDLFMDVDQSIVDKSTEHWLNDMSSLYEKSPTFKQYFGGHFHDDRILNSKYTMVYHIIRNLADYK